MLKKNVGTTDRTIRAIVGVALLVLALTSLAGVWMWVAGIIGVVLLGTAALGTCPPYAMLGISTCKVNS